MMQLDEILEENSIQAISKKTMISEGNLELLIAKDFTSLSKAKSIGFIAIIEREYNADLSDLKKSALSYYDNRTDLEDSINIALPQVDEKKERSKLFSFLILGLLAYASWYFFTQFDKKTLGTLLPFGDDKLETPVKQPVNQEKEKEEKKDVEVLKIDKAIEKAPLEASEAQSDTDAVNLQHEKKVVTSLNSQTISSQSVKKHMETSTNHANIHTLVRNKKILLLPNKKLWFGLIDTENAKRTHFSITKQYEIDVSKKTWLLATSPARFALINNNETQEYNDARAHYFKISKTGVESLSKDEYIAEGGYKKW